MELDVALAKRPDLRLAVDGSLSHIFQPRGHSMDEKELGAPGAPSGVSFDSVGERLTSLSRIGRRSAAVIHGNRRGFPQKIAHGARWPGLCNAVGLCER